MHHLTLRSPSQPAPTARTTQRAGPLAAPGITRLLATLTLAAVSASAAQAATVLFEQAPLHQSDAAANGTDGQAPLLAETFSFTGTAHSLAWWGTLALGFQVNLYADAGQGLQWVASTQDVAASQAGFAIDIDGQATDIYRYSIDLGSLSDGLYALTVNETHIDTDGGTWYWLLGSGGDNASISGFGERDVAVNSFDLSLQVLGERHDQPLPEPSSWMLALAALYGCRRAGCVFSRSA